MAPDTRGGDEMWSAAELASYLKVPPFRVVLWRANGAGPLFVYGRPRDPGLRGLLADPRQRYRPRDVHRWIEFLAAAWEGAGQAPDDLPGERGVEPDGEVWTSDETAAHIGIAVDELGRLVRDRRGPRGFRLPQLGVYHRYLADDVRRWLAGR